MAAKCAGADAFFYTYYFAAIETVRGGGEKGMTCCETGAAAG